jgi:hypothetical protein
VAKARPDPDLQTQLETLFHVVRQEEIGWRFDDRLELADGKPPTKRLDDHGNWKEG